MGCVYRGRHEDGQEVAIKTIRVDDPSMQRALANEWEVLIRVEHPYLVNEREILQIQDHLYLVMEFIESQNLRDWIEATPREERLAALPALLDKLVEVLEYLHGLNPPVIVRDLKPDNILLRPNGDIKLIDFGIARALEGSAKTEVALKGFASAAYAPLEQYSAQATTSQASDIYSLGSTLFHIVSGKLPTSAIDMLQGGLQPEKMLLDWGVESTWASLVGAAMKQKAQGRISLKEFRARIPRSGSGPEVAPAEAIRVVSVGGAPRSRSDFWYWVALVAILAVAAFLFLGTDPNA